MSAVGCCLRKYVFDAHQKYPYKAFTWLEDPAGISGGVDSESCVRRFDRFTRSFCNYLTKHGGLDCAEARADLACMRALCFVDNAAIEARHASIRREVVVLSSQTHPDELVDISSRFVLRCLRRRTQSEPRKQLVHQRLQDITVDVVAQPARRKRKRGGRGCASCVCVRTTPRHPRSAH